MEAARSLIHQNGYRDTSIADIAEASGVPLGNIYYYFKTKDDLVSAAITQQRDANRQWYAQLDTLPSPKARLAQLLRDTSDFSDMMTAHGCPVGSLCQELDKSPSAISDEVDVVLKEQIDWAAGQFLQMGHADGEVLGVQLVSRLQGAVLVAHALKDSAIIAAEIGQLQAWIDSL
ncbi:MAG: helix-turn-helix domain-containing protein [Acidiferrobacterales bacterium]